MAHPVQVEVTGGPVQQFDLIHQLVPLGLPDQVGQGGIVRLDLGGGGCPGVGVGGEMDHLPILPVVDALELLATADGPVHGVGVQTQLLLQFLAQLKGVPGLPVHLVDEGEDGDVPHGAYLEQLSGLGLHALGRVDDHDGGVGGHQGAVGVLREVLVARGVQDVDAVALILELHYRGGNGNAALLLNLHPVGGGRPGVLLALDLAGLGDSSAVEQELLRQGRLTGVRVGDDGKGAATLDLRFVIRQKGPLPLHLIFTGFNKLFYHSRPWAARGGGGHFSCILWGKGPLPTGCTLPENVVYLTSIEIIPNRLRRRIICTIPLQWR